MLSRIIILLIATVCGNSFAENKVVKIATLSDYAPFCMVEEHYQIKQIIPKGQDAVGFAGYSWDVLRESYHEMGYTIHLSISPWIRAKHYVENKMADILFPTGKNAKRNKQFFFSQLAINQTNFLVYVRKDSQLAWQDLSSLQGLIVGVKRGFNYGDKWNSMQNINIQNVTSIQQGFEMLDNKRIDGFLGYEHNWDHVLKSQKWVEKFKKLPVFDTTQEYLAALKTNPNAKALLADYDRGKKRLISSGKLDAIQNKWFGQAKPKTSQ